MIPRVYAYLAIGLLLAGLVGGVFGYLHERDNRVRAEEATQAQRVAAEATIEGLRAAASAVAADDKADRARVATTTQFIARLPHVIQPAGCPAPPALVAVGDELRRRHPPGPDQHAHP